MNKQIIFVYALLLIAGSFAQRHVQLFKQTNQAGDNFRVNTEGTCINLNSADGRPFVSGRSGGAYSCTVWQGRGCPTLGSPGPITFGSGGANFWSNGAWSVRC